MRHRPVVAGLGNARDRKRLAALGPGHQQAVSDRAAELHDGTRTVAACWRAALDEAEVPQSQAPRPPYTTAAVKAITAASKAEHDLSGWPAAVLVEVRNRRGGWAQMEDRPGSWEAGHVLALLDGTEPEGGW